MSEHITHLAVAEDSARLVCHDPNFNQDLKYCIQQYPDALRLGSVTRSGDKFILPTIEKWRKDWQKDDPRSEKMAYLLGWAGHLAGDRTFKPVFRMTDLAHYVRGYPGPPNASVYHDAITFGEVYQHGQTFPFHPSALTPHLNGHQAAEWLPINHIENAFAMSFADQLTQIKTFLPDNLDEWDKDWKTIEKERQQFYVEIPRYTEAHHQPQPSRLKKYILDPNFYDRNDPIIQLTRSLQNGEESTFALADALKGTENQSLYAQSIKLGYEFMMAASDFFMGKISMEEARKRSRTGTRHKEKLTYYIELAKAKGE